MSLAPFPGCYWVTTQLLAGPIYTHGTESEIEERIEALADAGVTWIISLIPRSELLWSPARGGDPDAAFERETGCFRREFFPLIDGQVPERLQVRTILDSIDRNTRHGHTLFLHCLAGRGRSGVIAGCYLARHRALRDNSALTQLTELRAQYDLFSESPETDQQREFVASWKPNE